MQFQGHELDFSIYDPDDLEKYEAALKQVASQDKQPAESSENGSWGDTIRAECAKVFQFFDALFGDGFHKELFGGKTNLLTCLDTFEAFVQGVDAQKDQLQERIERFKRYSPHRADG